LISNSRIGVIVSEGIATITGNTIIESEEGVRLTGRVSLIGNNIQAVDPEDCVVLSGGAFTAQSNLCNDMYLIAGRQIGISSETDLDIRAGLNTVIESGAGIEIDSGVGMDISAGAQMALRGQPISLNGFGRPAARQGDMVQGFTIVTGSPTVFIGP
jgi:hypothetical protein